MDLDSTESETEDDGSESDSVTDSSAESRTHASAPPAFVQKLLVFVSGLRLLLSTIMNTAGKVVVTVQLGLAGTVGFFKALN